MSLIADTAFRIGAGIIIDKAYINRRDEIHTVPYNAQIDSIRAKFNQMVKDYNKYIKELSRLI